MPIGEGRGMSLNVTGGRLSRRTTSGLSGIEGQTIMRIASVASEEMVQSEKVRAVQRVAWDAMCGHARLLVGAAALSRNDPMKEEDFHYFSDIAKYTAGELIVELGSRLRRI